MTTEEERAHRRIQERKQTIFCAASLCTLLLIAGTIASVATGDWTFLLVTVIDILGGAALIAASVGIMKLAERLFP